MSDKDQTEMELESEHKVVSDPGSTAYLISKALEHGSNIETLEKLMGLQERWEAKEAKKSFLDAMAKFQINCPPLKRDKRVNFSTQKGVTNYFYTPLASIREQIKVSLANCGLSYRWETKEENNRISMTCIVSHVSGHSETNTMSAERDSTGNKNSIQSIGSTMTYLQRYTLIGALGISTADDDTDANPIGEKPKKKQLPELTEKSEAWEDAKRAVREEGYTIEQIRKKYSISEKNYEKLCGYQSSK